MSLALLPPMLEWVQQLRVKTRQASQILGIDLVGLTLVGIDEPQLAGIGHKDLVATLLQHPACPRRVGTGLDCYTHGLLRGEASSESLGGGAQPTFLDHLATVLVDEAEVGVLVSEVQSGCHQWMLFATIHSGPILLSFGLIEPV